MVDLDRHSRHILLPQVGAGGQTKLSNSRVLCLGAGGLGSSHSIPSRSGHWSSHDYR